MANPADPMAEPDDENPEWTEADFARARPFREVFPGSGDGQPAAELPAEPPSDGAAMTEAQSEELERLRGENAALRAALKAEKLAHRRTITRIFGALRESAIANRLPLPGERPPPIEATASRSGDQAR
jgi:hypothetical protein